MATHFAFAIAIVTALGVWLSPLLGAEPPPDVPAPAGANERFGLSLEERQEIFAAVARREASSRATAERNFPNAPWSVEDDRSSRESMTVLRVALMHSPPLSASHVYLILDEGIRNHWLAPDGEPLPAVMPPLDPRRH